MKKKAKNILGITFCLLSLVVITGVITGVVYSVQNDNPSSVENGINKLDGFDKVVFNYNENKIETDIAYINENTYQYKVEFEPSEATDYDFIFTSSSEYVKVEENYDGVSCTLTVLAQFKNDVYLNIKEEKSGLVKTVELSYSNYEEDKLDLVVCYYFDGIEDSSKRIVEETELNQEIDPNSFIKEFDGYSYESISGSIDSLDKFNISESTVINLNYKADKIQVTCEYYLDNVLNSSDEYEFDKGTLIYRDSFIKSIEGATYDSSSISESVTLSEDLVIKFYYLSNEITNPDKPGSGDEDNPGHEVTYKVNGSAEGTWSGIGGVANGTISGYINVEGYSGLVYLSFSSSLNTDKATAISVTDGRTYPFENEKLSNGSSDSSGFAGGNFNSNGGSIYVFTINGVKIGSIKYSMTEIKEAVEVTGNLSASYVPSNNSAMGIFNGEITIKNYSGDVYLSFSSTFNSSKSTKYTVTDGIPFKITDEKATNGSSGSSGFAGGNFNSKGGTVYVYINSSRVASISYDVKEISITGSLTGVYTSGSTNAMANFNGNLKVNGYSGDIYLSFESVFNFSKATKFSVKDDVSLSISNQKAYSGMSGYSGFAGGSFNTSGGKIYVYLSTGASIGSIDYTITGV